MLRIAQPEDEEEDFYTVQEVADKLKVTHQTVRAWINAGDLLACRFNGTLRVRKDDFKAFVNISRGISNEKVP